MQKYEPTSEEQTIFSSEGYQYDTSRLTKSGIKFKHFPISTKFSSANFISLLNIFNLVKETIEANGKVIIHSNTSTNRAPKFVACYLILFGEMNAKEAVLHVRTMIPECLTRTLDTEFVRDFAKRY